MEATMAERGAATRAGAAANGRIGTHRTIASADRSEHGRGSRRSLARQARSHTMRRVRVSELILGIFLVAAGALGAVLWATREPTQRVLVAAVPIVRGQSLDASMVRWAEVRGDQISATTDPAGLGGKIAVVDIEAGSPIQAAAFRDPVTASGDLVEYGLALDAGEYPYGLAVGDHVIVVVLPEAIPGEPDPQPVTLNSPAEVVVAPAAELAAGDPAIINVLVPRADVVTLAAADHVKLGRIGAEA
jgi:hypothetical protein